MASFIALVAGLWAGAAEPEQSDVRLEWTAPLECPDGSTVRGWVDDVAPVVGTATARGRIERDGDDLVLTLEIDGEVGSTRSLRAPDCALLGRAAAVVIAVSLDPVAVAQAIDVAQAAAQTSADVPPPPPAALRVATPDASTPGSRADVIARPPVRRRGGAIEYGASLGIGVEGLLLPSVGPGIALAPFVGTRDLHVEAAVQYWLPRASDVAASSDVRARVQMVSAGIRACPILGRGRVRFPLCVGIDAGGLFARATGDDVRNPNPASEPWAGVVLAPGVRVAVAPRVSLGVAVEGVISLYRPRFGVVGLDGDLYRTGPGGLRGLFYVQLHRRQQKK